MSIIKEWYNNFYRRKLRNNERRKIKNTLSPWNSTIAQIVLSLSNMKKNVRILEIGCGSGELLMFLSNFIDPSNLYGVDISNVAINSIKGLPRNNLKVMDIEKEGLKEFPANFFDVVIMAEVIEHLNNPFTVLREARRVLRPYGYFIVSFPNYLNTPWLLLRILAEKLNRPHWINLQPIDKIYHFFLVKRIIEREGFTLLYSVGTVYLPPLLYRYEPPLITNLLNKCHLVVFAFHPVLVFFKEQYSKRGLTI